ncbi:MAG: hypothetical protein IPL39_20795 [Opitutaceae bacterium]|nr:hypothetical protein [Opitutaceae bacterium]
MAAFAFLAVIAFAQPTLTAPATSNLGAGQVTLALKSSAAGTGYFTLLEGSAPKLGTGAQTKAGKDGNGAAAARFGSLKLAANTAAGYTLGNLKAGTAYTICFTADDGATLQPTVATVGFATNASVNLEGAPWAVAGDRLTPGSNPGYTSVAFAPDGTPYVAFQNDSSDYRATVKQLVGGKWTQVGNADFSVSTASFLVLAFAPNGIPHVAY